MTIKRGVYNKTCDSSDATISTTQLINVTNNQSFSINETETEKIRPGNPETMHNLPANNLPNENIQKATSSSIRDLKFQRRGLHISNLNIRHLKPTLEDVKLLLSRKKNKQC